MYQKWRWLRVEVHPNITVASTFMRATKPLTVTADKYRSSFSRGRVCGEDGFEVYCKLPHSILARRVFNLE